MLRWDGVDVDAADVRAMTAALLHRGPDGFDHYVRAAVGIGHTRLAIIDPEHGAQPMLSADGRIAITYNGELYNFRELRDELARLGHRFRTDCDTEVVLAAWQQWGERCVERFRGMFAFAVVDWNRRCVFLARDHFGIKPMVYFHDGKRLCFASELRALRRAPRCPDALDLAAIDRYLALSYIPAPLTAFRDIRKLAPAHTLTVGFDGRTEGPVRYWALEYRPDRTRSADDWVRELESVLRDSVRAHLVSDVPFGAFLSGGLDSSVVVSLMAQEMNEPVQTFSIGFRESELDELPHAAVVRDRWHTLHREQIVTSDALDVVDTLVERYGEPFGDWSAVPVYRLAQLAREHVPMVLSGDGGDEAFAGYPRYHERLGAGRRHALGERLSAWVGRTPDWEEHSMMVLRSPARAALWRSEHLDEVAGGGDPVGEAAVELRRLPLPRRAQLLDYRTYLPGAILTKVDIAAMAHGLEVRTPLVDLRVAGLAATMPTELLVERRGAALEGKAVLKRVLSRWFPDTFVHRPKRGFVPPVATWFARGSDVRVAVEDTLSRPGARIGDLFEPAAVAGALDALDRDGTAEPVWLLYMLERWLRLS